MTMRRPFHGSEHMSTTMSEAAGRWRGLATAALFGLGLAVGAAPVATRAQVIATARPSAPQSKPASDDPAPTASEVGAAVPQTPPPPAAASPSGAPSEIMAVNLIRLLVKQGVITQAAADGLMQQAQAETQQARMAVAAAAPPPPGVVRVPYVPQIVRDQIRDDIKKDVLAEAKQQGWAAPGAIPSWVDRVSWFGDFRFRDQFNRYSANNDPQLIDYAAFNANGPIDINASTSPNALPFLNTRTDRNNQLSLRARFGVNFAVTDWVGLTVRLATGNDNSPVSTTQLLGGGLTKKNIWLDQAYLTLKPVDWATATLGRVPNTFLHTDLVFDDNLNLDGVLASADHSVGDTGVRAFAAAGAFPLDYVSDTFPANGDAKARDRTKWLLAAQAGAKFQPRADGWSIRGGVSYYDYSAVKGDLSRPCDLSAGAKQCSSDATRPSFMQKGNSLFLLRDITPPAASPTNYAEPQFVGLVYDYRLIDAVAEFEAPLFGNIHGLLQGDYVRNLAYDPGAALARGSATQPVTNYDVNTGYKSGPNGYMIKAVLGTATRSRRGDWFLSAGYKYIEPDAVLDAFNDHDFHLGGTNAKGYILTGGYYFARDTWIDTRWFSADQVYGPPLAIDVLQLELQTRF